MFIELFVVLMFAVAWAILELVARRFDKAPTDDDERGKSQK